MPANFFASIAAFPPHHQQVDLREQRNYRLLHFFPLRTRIAGQQRYTATRDIAEVRQTPFERCLIDCPHFRCAQIHVADAPDLARLLSRSAERQRQRSTINHANEIAPSHSITSSANASSEDGMVRPDALADFKLISSWYLVGW